MAHQPPLPLEFVTSATNVRDLPPTAGEVAVVGRSNVGKSSLINALANRKALAKVSKTPGRTQLLNLFALPEGGTLVDLPGYGYAQVPAAVRARWPEMIDGYLLGRQNLRRIILLVDAAVGPTANDQDTLGWLRSHDLPVSVVATKHDKVKPSKRGARRAELAAGCLLGPDDVLWVSAAKQVNIDELRGRIREWVQVDSARPGRIADGSSVRRGPGPAAGGAAEAEPITEPGPDGEWDDEDEW
jgi:GTP-binding protein